jgi:hypothetical protein
LGVFQPKGLPKGQMVAMTMNVLKWTPKFGFCFWNIQCNLRIVVITFLYTYNLFFLHSM